MMRPAAVLPVMTQMFDLTAWMENVTNTSGLSSDSVADFQFQTLITTFLLLTDNKKCSHSLQQGAPPLIPMLKWK